MSQENVEIVRKLQKSVVETLELPPELYTPDFELDVSDVSPDDASPIRGIQAAEAALRLYWETFDDFRTEIVEVIHADEERVVQVIRDRGRIRGSDAEVSNRYFQVFTFRDGRIARLSVHTDRNRALEAAGLSE